MYVYNFVYIAQFLNESLSSFCTPPIGIGKGFDLVQWTHGLGYF